MSSSFNPPRKAVAGEAMPRGTAVYVQSMYGGGYVAYATRPHIRGGIQGRVDGFIKDDCQAGNEVEVVVRAYSYSPGDEVVTMDEPLEYPKPGELLPGIPSVVGGYGSYR